MNSHKHFCHWLFRIFIFTKQDVRLCIFTWLYSFNKILDISLHFYMQKKKQKKTMESRRLFDIYIIFFGQYKCFSWTFLIFNHSVEATASQTDMVYSWRIFPLYAGMRVLKIDESTQSKVVVKNTLTLKFAWQAVCEKWWKKMCSCRGI